VPYYKPFLGYHAIQQYGKHYMSVRLIRTRLSNEICARMYWFSCMSAVDSRYDFDKTSCDARACEGEQLSDWTCALKSCSRERTVLFYTQLSFLLSTFSAARCRGDRTYFRPDNPRLRSNEARTPRDYSGLLRVLQEILIGLPVRSKISCYIILLLMHVSN
jgi:hypothetical protein